MAPRKTLTGPRFPPIPSTTQGQCWQAVSVAPGAIRNAFRGGRSAPQPSPAYLGKHPALRTRRSEASAPDLCQSCEAEALG